MSDVELLRAQQEHFSQASPPTDAEVLTGYVRDNNKAQELARQHPGTHITVNGAYAFVPEPRWDERIFGLKLY